MRRYRVLFFVAGILLVAFIASAEEGKVAMTNGTVVSADAQSSTLVVTIAKEPGQPKDVTFTVSPETKIMKGSAQVSLSDVKSGDKVTVRFKSVADKSTAVTILVESGK